MMVMPTSRTVSMTAFTLALCLARTSTAASLVAVDVGHTLEHPGATSARGATEFSFNRELSTTIQQSLSASGFATQLINEQGVMKNLKARSHAAANADFFLSVHHDSMQPGYLSTWSHDGKTLAYGDRFSGFSLFVSRKNPEPATSLKCASAIGNALIQAGFKPSRHHAEPIPGENRPFADETNGVYYYDDLVVLKTAHQPAVLIEAGIILNRKDELQLREPATRNMLAKSVARALADCLNR